MSSNETTKNTTSHDESQSAAEESKNVQTHSDEKNATLVGEDSEHKSDDGQSLRRSTRDTKPTDKMAEYMTDEAQKRGKRLIRAFDQWKSEARSQRITLKTEINEEELGKMKDSLNNLEQNVVRSYDHLRLSCTPGQDIVRKVDACSAITKDINSVINERLAGLEDITGIKNIARNKYAKSVFSDISSVLSESQLNAAADLEIKREEVKHQEIIDQKRLFIQQQEAELAKLEHAKSIAVAEVKVKAYSNIKQENNDGLYGQEPTPLLPTAGYLQNGTSMLDPTAPIFDPFVRTTQPQPVVPEQHAVNSLAKAFADSVNLNRLPVPEPTIFTGDPLRYVEWRTAFNALIERKGIADEEKIFYLKKYIGGEARQAIEGYFFSGSSSAYQTSRKVLEERYGHPFIVQRAFRNKLDKWPKINERDAKGLRDFGDFLKACQDATPQIPSLKILDDCTENQRLIAKLPTWAALRWNRKVQEHLYSGNDYPTFFTFVDFITKEARIACNPISSLSALGTSHSKGEKGKVGVRVLNTNLDAELKSNAQRKRCDYCEREGHLIYNCTKFCALKIDEKRTFIKEKDLCYGCLRKGHKNSECRRKHTCGTCKGKHPTCMHEDNHPLKKQSPKTETEEKETCREKQAVGSVSSFRTSRSCNRGTSMIVPVWISTEGNPRNEILTYALLDTQSDTTFILRETASALDAKQEPVRLSLSTMTAQRTVIESSKVSELKVRGFKASSSISINQAYTREFIPAERSHIPVRDTVKDWPHLQEITNEIPPLQSCEVGLLIGYNCPQALAPICMINGNENQPYAVQTILGWSIVGLTKNNDDFTLRPKKEKIIACIIKANSN
ncbi:hypothetical protein FSP39_018746 [Pinctada imbricata]|uniref:CCHC-type domain-containing protein n=1 Tax=Pinctada imbricata TaxID=66713 RepID=A0AA89BXM6_PINIB|nr:hypothetical protein FSP39_018746 [Pinctada imbricata]